MFHKSAIVLSALFALSEATAFTVTGPAPNQIFKVGGNCPITWTPDTTGGWKKTLIQLMTGDNFQMIVLETVATVDGATTSTFTWPCPDVKPYSAIYFYQFTDQGNVSDIQWTGRWAISADGTTITPPANSTQPDGEAIPWGIGALVGNGTSTTNGTTTSGVPPTVSNTTSLATSSTSSVTTSTSGSTSTTTDSPKDGKTTITVTSTSSGSSVSQTGAQNNAASGAEKLVVGTVGTILAGLAMMI